MALVPATRARVYLRDSATHEGRPAHALIVEAFREAGLEDLSVHHGIMGFDRASEVYAARRFPTRPLRFPVDLPVVVEAFVVGTAIGVALPAVLLVARQACRGADLSWRATAFLSRLAANGTALAGGALVAWIAGRHLVGRLRARGSRLPPRREGTRARQAPQSLRPGLRPTVRAVRVAGSGIGRLLTEPTIRSPTLTYEGYLR